MSSVITGYDITVSFEVIDNDDDGDNDPLTAKRKRRNVIMQVPLTDEEFTNAVDQRWRTSYPEVAYQANKRSNENEV